MVPGVRIKKVAKEDLFIDLLPRKTKKAFLECARFKFFMELPWYLAGGTALALQVGHRQSLDLDFFLPKIKFPERNIEKKLLATNKWKTSYLEDGMIFGNFLEAKMSFIAYPFFIPLEERLAFGNIRILLPHDIAAMKVIAISQRGKKRDFVDLYWYCQNHEPLFEIIQHSIKQYPGQETNLNHILKSLEYFADADKDPMPRIFFKANWQGIKQYFKSEAVTSAKKLLRL